MISTSRPSLSRKRSGEHSPFVRAQNFGGGRIQGLHNSWVYSAKLFPPFDHPPGDRLPLGLELLLDTPQDLRGRCEASEGKLPSDTVVKPRRRHAVDNDNTHDKNQYNVHAFSLHPLS